MKQMPLSVRYGTPVWPEAVNIKRKLPGQKYRHLGGTMIEESIDIDQEYQPFACVFYAQSG
jgi:hypothetical protein